MKISDNTYKGFKYQILFADRGDWGKHLNHFHTFSVSNFNGGFALSLNAVKTEIETQIDLFLSTRPTTVKELVEKLDDQLVWTDYEGCHLDEVAAKVLIENFLETLPLKSRS